MKVLVTGVTGQLGFDVATELIKRGYEVTGTGLRTEFDKISQIKYISMDITEPEIVRSVLLRENPQAVIHCAAWTAVDAAEEKENRQKVYMLNTEASVNIARCCKELSAVMIHISTDYVFGGTGNLPIKEDEAAAPANYYGYTKYEAEKGIQEILDRYYIVRIAWAYGLNGNNFVKTMLRVAKNNDIVRVVSDQTGTPTYTKDIAPLLADMLVAEKYGVYHVTNEGGYISWYDFACEIYRQAGVNVKVEPVLTSEYGKNVARRPYNSRLDKSKLKNNGFAPLPDWKDGLKRFLDSYKDE